MADHQEVTDEFQVGNAITVKERRRKLFTNKSDNGYRTSNWSHVVFEHPATFDTSALEPNKKEEIIKDLITFTKKQKRRLRKKQKRKAEKEKEKEANGKEVNGAVKENGEDAKHSASNANDVKEIGDVSH
ncbi:AAA domain-containing protein [Forsythia ovata]|uniref:AAA domain-containing protein n=1 Tax=Forsythia ovata TaxID=205694 RepID=A0ABD1UTD3_9LAMI